MKNCFDRMTKGLTEGHTAGLAQGQVRALFAVMAARGVEVSAEQAARIRACRGLQGLEEWLRRAGARRAARTC
jgi:hypothetical protein